MSVVGEARSWPEDGLEFLGRCPVCHNEQRQLLFERLTDNCFFVAPGEWTMWRCTDCETAYLDPRPNIETIGIAYEKYYTHTPETSEDSPTGRIAKLKQALGNGYRNRRFGTQLCPASRLGPLAAALRPMSRLSVDATYRYLPPPTGRIRRLLDFGCGDGSWLETARTAGWEVAGVELDPVARRHAAKRGIDVREDLANWSDSKETFDFITLNHVIEHLHHPESTLASCFELLRPDGILHIETPNARAVGLELHGRHWRGLEPPRHLMLFSNRSLRQTLSATGFQTIRFHRRPHILGYLSQSSARIAAGGDPYATDPIDYQPPGRLARLRAFLSLEHSELLVVTCRRPI